MSDSRGVYSRMGLEVLRHRFPSEYADDFAFRAIARRNFATHKSYRYAGANRHSVLLNSSGDSVAFDVANTCRRHIPFDLATLFSTPIEGGQYF